MEWLLIAANSQSGPGPWVAGLIASLIGSAFGATAANMFSLRREFRQEAMRVFIKTFTDAQTYKTALMHWITKERRHTSAFQELQNMRLNPRFSTPEQRDAALGRVQEAHAERIEANRELHDAIGQLRADCLAAGLLFDKKADELGKSIVVLYASKWDGSEPEQFENEVMNPRLHDVEQKMKPLWNSVKTNND